MEVVVALNPHVFAGEEVTLAEALERLREQGKILKSTRISLVRTEQVESVTWAKKQQDQDRSTDPVLKACVRTLDTLAEERRLDKTEASAGEAFGVEFREDGVSLLILEGEGKVPKKLEDIFLRLQRSCNVSVLRAKHGLAEMIARITRAYCKDSEPSNPYVPTKKCEVNLKTGQALGILNLWEQQWDLLCKHAMAGKRKNRPLQGMSPAETRQAVLKAILEGDTPHQDLKSYPLLKEMLFLPEEEDGNH